MRPQVNKKPSHDVFSFRCSSQGSPWSLLAHLPLLTHNKQPALLSQYGCLLLQGLSCSLRPFTMSTCGFTKAHRIYILSQHGPWWV